MIMVEKICNFRGFLKSSEISEEMLRWENGKRPVISEVFLRVLKFQKKCSDAYGGKDL